MKQGVRWLLIIGALMALTLAAPLAAQDETGVARVRIGYFAFDPTEYDTFVDDESIFMGLSWWPVGWMSACVPGAEFMRCFTATPFLDFPAGEHRLAFAPAGKGLDAAVLGPKAITFEAGHAYSLAITGAAADDHPDLLVIDETQAFADADWSASFLAVAVNNLKGAAAIEGRTLTSRIGTMEYAHYIARPYPSNRTVSVFWDIPGTPRVNLCSLSTVPLPPLSDFEAITGSYPGTCGKEVFLLWNWGNPRPFTPVDGGAVTVGDTIAGSIAEPGQQARYTLTLDASTSLNLYARATGPRTKETFSLGQKMFDPILYLYDSKGMPLYWQDELSLEDDATENFDAGLEGITLKAGTYTIQIGGTNDSMAGPFALTVEAAQ